MTFNEAKDKVIAYLEQQGFRQETLRDRIVAYSQHRHTSEIWDQVHLPDDRFVTVFIQLLCVDADLNPGPVDGWYGHNTEEAFLQLVAQWEGIPNTFIRTDETPSPSIDRKYPAGDEASMNAFYGPVGQNMVTINIPYPMRLAWDLDTVVTRMTVNAKLAEDIPAILQQVLDHYGMGRVRELGLDIFGGCLNVRKKRGGTTWSIHSWGAALDFDPARNKLRWGADKAQFAKPEYNRWWEIWEEHGWVSLGRRKNYDWMHVQAANL